MTATQIARELDACRNARPRTDEEVAALLVRIDAAGETAARMKTSKLVMKLLSEASELSARYRGRPECRGGVFLRVG